MPDPLGSLLIAAFLVPIFAAIVVEGLTAEGVTVTKVAKALVAALTALGTWGATALDDNAIEGAEWFGLCGVLVAGLLVWAVPNTKEA